MRLIKIYLALPLIVMTALFAPAHAQWVKQNVDTKASFRGLSVVDEKVVWASGTGGTVIRTVDGILVGEQSNAGKWWLGRYKGQAALDPAIVAAAPHPAGGGGPSQGPWGTLDEWTGVGAFANAKVVAFGFSLGSNSGQNNGVISAINFNGASYTFGSFSPSVQAAPGATVWTPFSTTFVVPANCPGQWLRVETRPGDRVSRTAVWLDDLAIVPDTRQAN